MSGWVLERPAGSRDVWDGVSDFGLCGSFVEFRANRDLEGDKLIVALRNGIIELKRLETWMKTRDRNNPAKMVPGDDFTVEL